MLHSQSSARPSLLRANMWYLLAAAGLHILSFVLLLITRHMSETPQYISEIIRLLYEVTLLALPVVLFAASNRSSRKNLRFNRPDVRMLLLTAALAAVGTFATNYLTTWWLLLIEALGGTPQASGIAIPTDTVSLLGSLFLVGIVPGVCEEMLFRGGLLSAWECFGKRNALIVTSVLFAFLHGTVAGLPNQLLMGFVLGYIVLLSNSVFTGIVYHTVHNSVTLLLAYIAQKSTDFVALSSTLPETAGILESLGGAVGLSSLLLITVFFAAMFLLLLQMLKEYAQEKRLSPVSDPDSLSPVPDFIQFLPLLAALSIAAFSYEADIAATFGG